RWQQFTGAVMAKGLEDTTFYVHNPLVSVNEVGGDSNGPEVYSGVEEFHRRNLARRDRWPQTMNATSTHDTKRSEDVRTRVNVLSEMPLEWKRCLRRWSRYHPDAVAPTPNEQVLIFQSMLGAWPIESDRFKQYIVKGLREGKTHTSWTDINEDYELRVLSFIDSLYANEEFLAGFVRFYKKISYFGAVSSLSQVVLKVTSPGIPDFYRGTEIWDLTLADPDNRRPLDFSLRAEMLERLSNETGDLDALLEQWPDGRLKMYITYTLLSFRRRHSDLFSQGEYIPLRVRGAHANHIVAFARRHDRSWSITAVPRLCGMLTEAGAPPLGKKIWKDTEIAMPPAAPASWTDELT